MSRREDPGLLTGATPFVRDLDHHDCQHLVFVRSADANGDIAAIDTSQALAAPGVTAVLTGQDLDLAPFRFYEPIPEPFARPPLATERVRMAGEPLAVVVAETQALAVDAADLVDVEVRRRQPSVPARRAASSPILFEAAGSNIVMSYDKGRVDGLFDLAAHVEHGQYPNQRLASAPLEPTGVLVRPGPAGDLEIWATGQGVHAIRQEVAKALDLDPELVRVRSVAVGGGFGGRHSAPIELIIVAATARHLGIALRWDESRTENLMTMVHGRAQDHRVSIGFDDDGLIVGLRVHNLADCGAYPHFGPLMPFMSRKLSGGPYRVPRIDYSWEGVVTTTNPVGPYRGAGQPEVTNGLERTIENAARSLGLDPLDLRRRNLISAAELPYRTGTRLTYDSGDYVRTLDRAAELAGYEQVRIEQDERRRRGERLLLGVGFACYVSSVDTSPEFASVEVSAEGVTVRCGTFNHGQAHATTIGGLVAERLGVPEDQVSYRDGDSAATPRGAGTGGSRSAQMAGGAAVLAAEAIVDEARRLASARLEADPSDLVVMPTEDGRPAGIGVAGVPASVVGWTELSAAANEQGHLLAASVDYEAPGTTHPSGTHASVVEVDPETGAVRLVTHVAVDDCGTVLNPAVVEGQQHGGSAAGIGQALLEEFVYDDEGNPRTVTFADYLVPSATELPSFITETLGIPTPMSLTGAKGIGENGAIAAPTSVQNAVIDALAPLGVTHVDLPLSPLRVWEAIGRASKPDEGESS